MENNEGKRQLQQQQSTKSSRSASPEPSAEVSPSDGEFRPLMRTPPPTRAGPPPSPPVPTRPVAPVAPEPSGPLPLAPCQVCGRTFLPQSLAKHVKICEKMTVKKRKTFDSSRQRREGTDLEQYLPKNFGLPENSPFLEKSPPPTAKPTPKPKVQSVRNAITKPSADLQKCPHCNRAFGVRAFERHVEWCADKAKILPAAPAQPPPHIADAKQRLNARTQYKAPLARGRKLSQNRDKSSNSRSASVESSRGISPPREFGDYRHGRARASESASSNDCQEDTSPHVPVIKNSNRHIQNSSSGDTNVKARQARLARDLSSSRNPKDSLSTTIQQSDTDPNISKNVMQNKQKNKLSIKRRQQLKKLEEIASKYSERNQGKLAELKREKSLIPVSKKIQKAITELDSQANDLDIKTDKSSECMPINENTAKIIKVKSNDQNNTHNKYKEQNKSEVRKTKATKTNPVSDDASSVVKVTIKRNNVEKSKVNKKGCKSTIKENSMSLDSLEDTVQNSNVKYQSIGINTELLCVPCVIHNNLEQKQCERKIKKKYKLMEPVQNTSELKIELLYKNPTIISSCDLNSRESLYESGDSKENVSCMFETTMTTENNNSDNLVINSNELLINTLNGYDSEKNTFANNNNKQNSRDSLNAEDCKNVSVENLEIINNSVEHISDTEANENNNEIECRYGSGETYTKFTEDPADLEEFMNLTDKMISDSNFQETKCVMDNVLSQIHTPNSSSLEAINKEEFENNSEENSQAPKFRFSDKFDELKCNLKELLGTAGDKVPRSVRNENLQISNDLNVTQNNSEIRNVCDMEHITVYGMKFNEQNSVYINKANRELDSFDNPAKLILPSIDENNKPEKKINCNKKRMQRIYKPNRKYHTISPQNRRTKYSGSNQFCSMIQDNNNDDDGQSISSEAPPLKLPRIENKKTRLDENYDPFASAARQMKELMSSDTNIPSKLSKEHNRTLPILRNPKEKGFTSYNNNNTKMMKDTLNKSYQKTPTLQRMKSFGSTNNDYSNSFGARCSSFRINRNEKKKSSQKLNTTFTKSSKENISTVDNKSFFNRNSNLNRSFSSYTASSYSTPKPKDKIPKIATSMHHSFQRTTIKQPVKLDKINKDTEKKNFVNLDSILGDDNNSSMTDSSYIDPRLINENDNLPINVNTILNNPDIISSMESLLTTENLPAKFESFSSSNINNNIKKHNGISNSTHKIDKIESNNNINKITAPIIDDLSTQYDKIMSSLEQSLTSKTSARDDESVCEDFDLEEFMTNFDEEILKHKLETKRTCSSTTRVVKQSELVDSNKTSEMNSFSLSPKVANGMNPVNKSMSLNFSSNNVVNENLFPSSVKRSTSLLDSIQKKSVARLESTRSRMKSDLIDQDLMQSLKDFDKLYASEKNEISQSKETLKYNSTHSSMVKRDTRSKPDRKAKKDGSVSNGSHTPNGKSSNDSAYSSLNRISPSKLSLCATKEHNGQQKLEQVPAGSDSGSHKDDARSISSEEFLAMERSAEIDEVSPQNDFANDATNSPFNDKESHAVHEKRTSSRASSRRSPAWRQGELSSSGSEVSLHGGRRAPPAPRLSRFCHECGTKFSLDTAKFCIECGIKRLLI